MNKQFLYIEPFVYSKIRKNQIFLYNTLSGCNIIETIDDKELNKLFQNNRFRIIEYNEKNFSTKSLNFIQKCRKLFMIDIHTGEKPFIHPFEKHVMYNREYLKSHESILKISSQVNEINIVLGKSTYCKNDLLNKNGINQFLFPTDLDNNTLNIESLINSLTKIHFNLGKVNIIGDYFRNKNYKTISEHFSNKQISHYSYYLDFNDSFFNTYKSSKNKFIFIVDFPCDQNFLMRSISTLEKKQLNFKFSFIVSSKQDLEEFQHLDLNEKYIKNIIPFYTKRNIDFFKEYVFIDSDDILEETVSKNELFSKMHYNQLFFGKLYFMPDNKIYPNPNFAPIGNFMNDWTYIFKEGLLNNPCWFKIRDGEKCSECHYQFLCPPISNYNLVIGKEDLCIL